MKKVYLITTYLFSLILIINSITIASTVNWSFHSLEEGRAALDKNNTNINKYDGQGRFPLIWAAKFNSNPNIVSILIDNRARVDMRDKEGLTPLMYAAKYNVNHKVTDVLIRKGANPNAWSYNEGKTPLIFAAKYNNHDVLNSLIEGGSHINEEDFSGMTPLMHAVTNEDIKVIELLIKAGADPKALDLKGRTPLIWASISSHNQEVVRQLLEISNSQTKDNYNKGYLDYLKINPFIEGDDFQKRGDYEYENIAEANQEIPSKYLDLEEDYLKEDYLEKDYLEEDYSLKLRPWGEKKNEVLASESLALIEDTSSKLKYKIELEDYKINLNYFFNEDDALVKIQYIIPYEDQYFFKSHYLEFLKNLTTEYGEPSTEDLINLNSIWERSTTKINLYSRNSSDLFEIIIEFSEL